MIEVSQVVLVVKNLPVNARDTRDAGSIAGLGRAPGVGNGNHCSILAWKNPMDREALWATVHRPAQCSALALAEHKLKHE